MFSFLIFVFIISGCVDPALFQDPALRDDSCLSSNTAGCSLGRTPRYLIMAPNRVRPDQIYQVFVTILRLEYGNQAISVHASLLRDSNEYASAAVRIDRPSSRILQLKMPTTAIPGDYYLQVKGNLEGKASGYVFLNKTKIEYSSKRAAVFIQMSKPIYKQGQKIHFRIIPLKPDLMPQYGTAVIYVEDPTGFPVQRWQSVQTNAGGIISQNFQLTMQPNYGTWHIRVDAFGHTYRHPFLVEEWWNPRFNVKVVVPQYVIYSDKLVINGVMKSNQTSGIPVKGNGTASAFFRPTEEHWNATRGWEKPYHDAMKENPNVPLEVPEYKPVTDIPVKDYHFYFPYRYSFVDYFHAAHKFKWTLKEIKELASEGGSNSIIGGEMVFLFNMTDWYSSLNRSAWAGVHILSSEIKMKWVGGAVRTFKPGSKMTVQLAVSRSDGKPVPDGGIVRTTQSINGGGSNTQNGKVVNGIVQTTIILEQNAQNFRIKAAYLGKDLNTVNPVSAQDMMGYIYYSPTESYISVITSTPNPKANEYMIFHVLTSQLVSRIYYQVISKGNIIDGDELEMTSRQKTFSLALSREMVPTARILVYYVRLPKEIVADVLHFFVDGMNHNKVRLEANKGKDFNLDTVEFNAYADPGSYLATSAILTAFYNKGLSDGITENRLIDELMSFDGDTKGTYRQLWRVSGSDYKYTFFHGTDYGIDGKTSLQHAGLVVLTDIAISELPNVNTCDSEADQYPCFIGLEARCYSQKHRCNGIYDGCPSDGADEWGCETEEEPLEKRYSMNRASRVTRLYDYSTWAWQEIFVKPDGRVDFRVDVPIFPLTWMVSAISVSPTLGLGIMEKPLKYQCTRTMYIRVEHPKVIVTGEQVGIRVTVFNYWWDDDYLEVLLTFHAGKDASFVVVKDFGITSSYEPITHQGDHQMIVFLEPGEAKAIYMPIIADWSLNWRDDLVDFHVTAKGYWFADEYYGKMKVLPNGVQNYYHTPYQIDLIREPSVNIPHLKINLRESFRQTYIRENIYVPGSPTSAATFFGDVVVPGFFEDYLDSENILHRPSGGGEMVTFNFAYNLLSLRYMRHSRQLKDKTLNTAFKKMKIELQRIYSYMNVDDKDGVSFKMFRDDTFQSLWLTAFVGKTLSEALVGEKWEQELYIPTELINKIINYICSRQNSTTGAFTPLPEEKVFDRKMASLKESSTGVMYSHEIPLTAYVLIALHAMENAALNSRGCLDITKRRAASYLSQQAQSITSDEVFFMAIATYALSLSRVNSEIFQSKLLTMQRNDTYFADSIIYPNTEIVENNIWYKKPRQEFMNEAYAVQSTAYALLALMPSDKLPIFKREQMMTWINTLRNSVGGFASTQDTIIAMEALFAFTNKDPNRNEFHLSVNLECSSYPAWTPEMFLNMSDYVHLEKARVPIKYVYGYVISSAQGVGRGMLQLTTTWNTELNARLKKQMHYDNDPTKPLIQFFTIYKESLKWSGRNHSIMEMTNCVSWKFTERSLTSGLAVLEIDIPTGYKVMNDHLRDYVQSRQVQNLRRAEFFGRRVAFYFDFVDTSKTCTYFRADRWFPVANNTQEYMIRVYDYYEPGMHQTELYKVPDQNRLDICQVCGSSQCPYCPYFNSMTVAKPDSGLPVLSIALFFLVRLFIHRDSTS